MERRPGGPLIEGKPPRDGARLASAAAGSIGLASLASSIDMAMRIQPVRVVGLFAVLTIVAVSVSVLALLWGLRERALTRDVERTDTLTRLLSQQTAQNFERSDATLRTVADRLGSSFVGRLGLDSLPVHLLLAAHAHGLGVPGTLFLVDAQGRVVNTTRSFPAPAVSVADRDYFRAFAGGRARGLYIGGPVLSRVSARWTVHLARALRNPDGSLRGVIVAGIARRQLESLYGYVQQDFRRPAALYLDDGRLLASLPHRDALLGQPAPELAGLGLPAPGTLLHADVLRTGGGERQLSLERVPGVPLLVGVGEDRAATLAAWRDVAAPVALGALLVCGFLGAAALLLGAELQREQRLDQALREADDRYRRTIDSVMDAMVSVDSEHRIILFNPAAERMFGMPAAEALGRPLDLLIPPRLRQAHGAHMRQFATSKVASREMAPNMEVMAQRADGSEFPVESAVSQTRIDGALQFTAVLRDVTERRRREAELQHMNRELRRLSNAQQTVREEERSRISRELHDDLGQLLTGIKLDLSRLVARSRDGRPATPQTFDSMRQLLDDAIAAVRRISTELRPRMLDDLGFGEALSWLAGEFGRRTGIEVQLRLDGACQVPADAVSTALFRIVQESLTNVARHAEASLVRIELLADHARLRLTVRDNGRGIDPQRMQSGVGLLSMRERANALGASLRIARLSDGGTEVELQMSLHEDLNDQGVPA